MKVLPAPEFLVVYFLISWFVLGPLPSQAALRYVDPENGSDARGDATKENPVKTIDKALDFAKIGDTLYLESGSFDSIVLPKALGIWGNPEDKATVAGPIEFGPSVTALVDLYYRDFILKGSQGFVFDTSLSIDGVQFQRLELQIEGSDVFIGGSGQLNVSGAGLLFDSLDFSQSGSGSSKALDLSVASGPITFSNTTASGDLQFNLANSPKNVQIKNVTLSNGVHISVENPSGLIVVNSSFSQSGLSIIGGHGTILYNSFSQNDDSAVQISSPSSELKGFEYELTNNTFESVSVGLDLDSVDDSSPLQIVFQGNTFLGKVDPDDTDAIRLKVDTISVDAKDNWYGDSSGPKETWCNDNGRGASIVVPSSQIAEGLIYRPWCIVADCSQTKLVRSACSAGDDPSTFIPDDADPMTPWGMSILIIAVCSVSYLIFLVIFFFAYKLKQGRSGHAGSDQEKLT